MKNGLPYLLLISAVIILASCGSKPRAIQMSPEEANRMNQQLVQAICKGRVEAVKAMCSDSLLKSSGAGLDSLVLQAATIFADTGFTVLYASNIQHDAQKKIDSLKVFEGSDSAFVMRLPVFAPNQYISLLLLHNRAGNGFLLTTLYAYNGSAWTLNVLQAGPYNLAGRNAPAWFAEARRRAEKGWMMDAVNYSSLAVECLQPAGRMLRYESETEITASYTRWMQELAKRYALPYTLGTIRSNPAVFRIYPEISREGFYPMVHYLSRISLADSAAIRLEYQQVRMEVARLFPGLNQEKEYIFFRAFNRIPEPGKEAEYVTFVDRLTP